MTNLVLHDCQERIYSTTVRHAPLHSQISLLGQHGLDFLTGVAERHGEPDFGTSGRAWRQHVRCVSCLLGTCTD